MFFFPYTESVSHYESVNRIEERRAKALLIDTFGCGLTLEEQMRLLLLEFVTCVIRGYDVVGFFHLDIRFGGNVGISVQARHDDIVDHALRSLNTECVNWYTYTTDFIFLRGLFRQWVSRLNNGGMQKCWFEH